MVPEHAYTGARALIQLHEHEMRAFLSTWQAARKAGVTLPETKDPDYVSMDALLRHVCGAARGYMVWICEKLELPDPGIDSTPGVEGIADEAETYILHVLEKWRTPLVDVPGKRYEEAYPSRWKTIYCIDAMMEHAVMHPLRHRFQLEKMMAGKS